MYKYIFTCELNHLNTYHTSDACAIFIVDLLTGKDNSISTKLELPAEVCWLKICLLEST